MAVEAKVSGLPDLRAALMGIVPKLRRRALRNALAAGAREVRNASRKAAPVISPRHPMAKSGQRRPGTMRDAISVRTSKIASRQGDVGVFVNVRPAKGAARGAKNPKDPFYWRWLEFGRQGRAGRALAGRLRLGMFGRRFARQSRAVPAAPAFGFLRAGAAVLPKALQVFIAKIGPQIARLNGGKAVQL